LAIYRQVHISFWQDDFVLDLTPEEKYFYLYLMTNSKTTQCGIYELPKKIIEFETGYNRETVDKLLDRFVGYGKILYCEDTKEIMIVNWIKHNWSTSPKVQSKITKELKDVKNKEFLSRFDSVCIQYGYCSDTGTQEEEEEEKEETYKKNKEEEEEKEKEETPYKKIIELYNSICTSLLKVQKITGARKRHIKARWNGDISLFETLFTLVEQSDFLTGRKPSERSPTWKADFDWLMNEHNMTKVLEGKYKNKANPEGVSKYAKFDDPNYNPGQQIFGD
jgi:hypothetical protein